MMSAAEHMGSFSEPYAQYTPSPDSPWALLLAHLANDESSLKKIFEIKEYLYLKDMRDSGSLAFDPENQYRFAYLKKAIADAYFVRTDFEDYLPQGVHAHEAGSADFSRRLKQMTRFLEETLDDYAQGSPDTIKQAVARAVQANLRQLGYLQELKMKSEEANANGRSLDENEILDLRTVENVSPDSLGSFLTSMLPEALATAAGRLTNTIDSGRAILSEQPEKEKWMEEFADALRRSLVFLKNPNGREDLTLIDLTFYIGEHRGASKFRGSTSGYYAAIDALTAGLVLQMPEQEKDRWSIDRAHALIDPKFQSQAFALKLAAINAKHRFGFTSEEIDAYGTVTGLVGTVMRAFDIDEIDDRFKQYLHNTGDHSLRTLITIAQTRDTVINRLKNLPPEEGLSPQDLQEQIRLAEESARVRAEWAMLHDIGEYLGELLGNNLVGKNEKEMKELKRLRDRIEDYVASKPVLEEFAARLKAGGLSGDWDDDKIQAYVHRMKQVMASKVSSEDGYNYGNAFDITLSKIFERLNTTHDIIAQRAVGRINRAGKWENQKEIDDSQLQYTLLYVFSKIAGHKAESTDPVDIAAFYKEEHLRNLEAQDHARSSWPARASGSATQFRKDLARIKDVPNTALPLDDFLAQRDIVYGKSVFKKFVDQTLHNHETLSQEAARARQIHDEATLSAVCHEMLHYAKKTARLSPKLDAWKIEKAVRKTISQGLAAAQRDLADRSDGRIGLQYLRPTAILSQERYRIATIHNDQIMGGFIGDPKKPQQITDLQLLGQPFAALLSSLSNAVAKPLYNLVNTLPTGLMLLDLQSITLGEFQCLLRMTAIKEAVADTALTGIGLLQGAKDGGFTSFVNNPDLMGLLQAMDTKSFAIVNSALTLVMQEPHVQQEAIRKSYGHILAHYHKGISEKYGIPADTIALIRKKRYLGKGTYDRNPRDPLPSGPLAEQFHDYFLGQYNGTDPDHSPKHCGPWDKKFAKHAERAERVRLHEIITEELTRTKDRLAFGTCDPAEQAKLSANLEKLAQAKKALRPWRKNPFFSFAAKYGLTTRFGSIATLGTAMAFSGVGAELTLPVLGSFKTSAIFGANLALAGGSAFLASLDNVLKTRVSDTNAVMRVLRNLPYLERDQNRGWYVNKGAYRRPEKQEAFMRDLIEGHAKNPGFVTQIADCLVASVTTPIRYLAREKTSANAFARQNTVTTIDTVGLVASTALDGGASWAAYAQCGLATGATLLFMRVGLYNMMMFEIQKDLEAGHVPDLETIKTRIAENAKEGKTNTLLLNAMNAVGRGSQKTALGRLAAKGLRGLSINNHIARLFSKRSTKTLARPAEHPACKPQ